MNELETKRVLYPRVTEIISKQMRDELNAIPKDMLENACIRGNKVHSYCAAWAEKLWIEREDIEAEYLPYYDQFVQWAEEHVEEFVHFSKRLYDDQLRFSGEFDMVVRLKGNDFLTLVDIKTSSAKSKSWPIQLSAYKHLCFVNEIKIENVLNLHLKKVYNKKDKNGEVEHGTNSSIPQVKMCINYHEDLTSSWDIFSSALRCYDYFCRKEKE